MNYARRIAARSGGCASVALEDGSSLTMNARFDGSTLTSGLPAVGGNTAFVTNTVRGNFAYGGSETSITISLASGSDFAFGDFRTVPEPMSLGLLASGLAMLGVARKRRATISG